jgi:hypothetical protein
MKLIAPGNLRFEIPGSNDHSAQDDNEQCDPEYRGSLMADGCDAAVATIDTDSVADA